MSWLLARVFNIDVETCSNCSGKMKIIAAIEDPKVIRKILEPMGLDTKPTILGSRLIDEAVLDNIRVSIGDLRFYPGKIKLGK